MRPHDADIETAEETDAREARELAAYVTDLESWTLAELEQEATRFLRAGHRAAVRSEIHRRRVAA